MLDGPRGARPDELPQVVTLADDVFSAEQRSMGPHFPTLFRASNAEWLRTFWDGDVAVSHAGFWLGRIRSHGRDLAVAHLGAVCTRPDYRGRGLAGALLADALPRLREAGVGLLLISGDRSLYRRIGARKFGRLLRFRVGRAAAEALASGWSLDRLGPPADGAAAAMADLQAREPVRYHRTAGDWLLLLPAKGYLTAGDGRGAALVRPAGGGGPAAYLLWGTPRRAADAGPPSVPIDEFAGPRAAVLGGLAAILEATGCETAVLQAQPGDGDLLEALRRLGVEADEVPHQGTARVVDPRRCGVAPDGAPLPAWADPGEPDAAAAWTASLAAAWELPRNDGLQYI